MTSRILVNKDLPEGAEVVRFVNKILLLVGEGQRLQDRLNSMASGDDFHQVAIELGLPDPSVVSSTQAADAWSILQTAINALVSAQVRELKRLDQGN